MNPLLRDREVAHQLPDSGAQLVFGWHQFAEACAGGAEQAGAESILVKPGEDEQLVGSAEPWREIAQREEGDPAVIVCTSGTTGTPKGATLTHGNLLSTATVGAT
jgi:long-chain acyl-CoA synthetase